MTISIEMIEFGDALKRGDTKFCLDYLAKNPEFAKRVENDRRYDDIVSPIGYAVIYGNPEVSDKLLSLGAKMNIPFNIGISDMRDTPMARVLTKGFHESTPRAKEVEAVFVKHYAARRQETKVESNRFDSLMTAATDLFKSFGTKLDNMIKSDVIGKGVAWTLPASAIGSALGTTAAVGAVPAIAAPVIVGAVIAGTALSVVHLFRNSESVNDKKDFQLRQEDFKQTYENLADIHDAAKAKVREVSKTFSGASLALAGANSENRRGFYVEGRHQGAEEEKSNVKSFRP